MDFDLLGDPIPDGHGEPGRPSHIATERNRSKIILLLAVGWTQKRIAGALHITVKTMRKHYSPQLRVRDGALDRVKAGHLSLLWDQAKAGNVAALKEIGKVIDRVDAARFGLHGDSNDIDEDDVPAPRSRLGKKEEATLAARTAGSGSGWGSDLMPPPSKMN